MLLFPPLDIASITIAYPWVSSYQRMYIFIAPKAKVHKGKMIYASFCPFAPFGDRKMYNPLIQTFRVDS